MPFADSLVPPNEVPDIVKKAEVSVPDNILLSIAIIAQNWRNAQSSDPDINFIIDAILVGKHPSPVQAKRHKINGEYLWD